LRLKIALVLVALALAAAVLTGKRLAELSAMEGDAKQPAAGGPRAPVLVELFTSEGCSSCPPADELLTRLEQTQPIAGAEVIALSEHVDYWNRLGWTDPYSAAEFSKRQNDYAGTFDTDEVYTPQMIVDGLTQIVGSNSNGARDAITNAARDLKANVTVTAAPDERNAASIALAVRVEGLAEVWKGDSAEVLLAITESDLRSNVSSGENAGRHLTHSAVVRKLSRLGNIDPRQGAPFSAQPVVRIDRAWKRENLKAVVFVQDHKSRRVLGVTALSLAR
jgi:hypothetical protein